MGAAASGLWSGWSVPAGWRPLAPAQPVLASSRMVSYGLVWSPLVFCLSVARGPSRCPDRLRREAYHSDPQLAVITLPFFRFFSLPGHFQPFPWCGLDLVDWGAGGGLAEAGGPPSRGPLPRGPALGDRTPTRCSCTAGAPLHAWPRWGGGEVCVSWQRCGVSCGSCGAGGGRGPKGQ